MRRLLSTAPHEKKRRRKEVTGVTGRWIRRWIGRGWRVWLVQLAGARGEVLGFATGASGHSQDQHVRSDAQRDSRTWGVDRTRWRVRSVTIGHVRSTKILSRPFLYSNRTSGVPRPVKVFNSVNSSRLDSKARPVNSSVASSHAMTEKITFHDRWRSNERNLKRDTWQASVK
jgi:hypothetical protein